jgi:hypothetical protein
MIGLAIAGRSPAACAARAYSSRIVLVLARPIDRILVLAGLLALTAGYIVIRAIVFDYGRRASNWAVCMMLGLFAIRLLPACKSVSLSYTPRNRALAKPF